MKGMDADLLARLMALPDGTRTDILEFLGATPKGDEHLEKLIDGLGAAMEKKRLRRTNAA